MAKTTLPVNFKDDIMNESMGGKRKYRLIENTDGTISLEDVTVYDQIGNNFGAGQINQTNASINAAADAGKIIDSLSTITATTQNGYMAGALAVKALNSETTKKKVYIANVSQNTPSSIIKWVNANTTEFSNASLGGACILVCPVVNGTENAPYFINFTMSGGTAALGTIMRGHSGGGYTGGPEVHAFNYYTTGGADPVLKKLGSSQPFSARFYLGYIRGAGQNSDSSHFSGSGNSRINLDVSNYDKVTFSNLDVSGQEIHDVTANGTVIRSGSVLNLSGVSSLAIEMSGGGNLQGGIYWSGSVAVTATLE